MGFQNGISFKNPRHGAPGPIGTSKSKMFMLYSHLFQGLAVPLDPAQSRFILAAENEWETNIDTS